MRAGRVTPVDPAPLPDFPRGTAGFWDYLNETQKRQPAYELRLHFMSEDSPEEILLADLFGTSFENLEQKLPSLIIYLTTGPTSYEGRGPKPVGGWNFRFEPWLLDLLVECLLAEASENIDFEELVAQAINLALARL